MNVLSIILSALISIPTPAASNQGCGKDCVHALTVALEWALERTTRLSRADPERTALDVEPRRYSERPPGAIDPDEEVAILRQVASDLGVEVVRWSDDEAAKACKSMAAPGCRAHWGRTLINIEELHFNSANEAEVIVRIVGFGDAWSGSSGGPYYHSLSVDLRLEKTSDGWKATPAITIIS